MQSPSAVLKSPPTLTNAGDLPQLETKATISNVPSTTTSEPSVSMSSAFSIASIIGMVFFQNKDSYGNIIKKEIYAAMSPIIECHIADVSHNELFALKHASTV